MFRIRIDPAGKYGRYFRPVAAALVIVLALSFAFVEILSSDRDPLAVLALVGAAAVGAWVLLVSRR